MLGYFRPMGRFKGLFIFLCSIRWLIGKQDMLSLELIIRICKNSLDDIRFKPLA